MSEAFKPLDIRVSKENDVPRDRGVYSKASWITNTIDSPTDKLALVARSMFKLKYPIRTHHIGYRTPGEPEFIAIHADNQSTQKAFIDIAESSEIERLRKDVDPNVLAERVHTIVEEKLKKKVKRNLKAA